MLPLVSIIVPIYNNEQDIKKCINALLEQSYKNLQIILVDDGSTDNTYDICKTFSDQRILLLKKTNGGASSARNHGLLKAKGKYIYFVDSDDYLEGNAIEKLVYLAEEKGADCVILEANNYTDEKELKVKKDGLSLRTNYPTMNGNNLILYLLRNKDFHAAPFLYFVHHSIYEASLKFEEGIMFEDELFSFQLLRKCDRVVCLREKLYNRKVRSGSVMTSTGKSKFRFYSMSRVLKKLIGMYEENPSDTTLKEYLSRICLLWYSYWKQLLPVEKKEKRNDYREIRKKILQLHGFDKLEVIVRCYSYYAWILYIIPGRCLRKIRLRSLK